MFHKVGKLPEIPSSARRHFRETVRVGRSEYSTEGQCAEFARELFSRKEAHLFCTLGKIESCDSVDTQAIQVGINLPVQNPIVLKKEMADVKCTFSDELDKWQYEKILKQMETLEEQIKKNKPSSSSTTPPSPHPNGRLHHADPLLKIPLRQAALAGLKVTQSAPSEFREESFGEEVMKRTEEGKKPRFLQIRHLGSLQVYCQDSPVHLQLSGRSITPLEEEDALKLLEGKMDPQRKQIRRTRQWIFTAANNPPASNKQKAASSSSSSTDIPPPSFTIRLSTLEFSDVEGGTQTTFHCQLISNAPFNFPHVLLEYGPSLYARRLAERNHQHTQKQEQGGSAGRQFLQDARKIVNDVFLDFIKAMLTNAVNLATDAGQARPIDENGNEEPEPPLQDEFFPGIFDANERIRIMYNLKQKQSVAKHTKIEGLRKLNNQVKLMLIQRFVPLGDTKKKTVLDLGCGKGQDLGKWRGRAVESLVGIDLAKQEIDEAVRRVEGMRKKDEIDFETDLRAGDLMTQETWDGLQDRQFDVVSMQLAMHYLMGSERQAAEFLSRVAQRLKPGGLFIGSTTNCVAIAHRLTRLKPAVARQGFSPAPGSMEFGNPVYKVSFSAETLRKHVFEPFDGQQEALKEAGFKQQGNGIWYNQKEKESLMAYRKIFSETWGIPYRFWLIEAIDGDEFNVPFTAFQQLAEDFGLDVIFALPFDFVLRNAEVWDDESGGRLGFRRWLEQHRASIEFTADQQDVFALYMAFAFRKRGEAGMPVHGAVGGAAGQQPAVPPHMPSQGQAAPPPQAQAQAQGGLVSGRPVKFVRRRKQNEEKPS
uniref:mRNA (guanine-N(7))-methyltransferase n=1 Tax=Chromera velia CCMP2878 TaxID=1169474 RepID=A0A0G4HKR4_9ALVE|eukprot:Cvel_7312.t1-p1 / transcript=Cvel_7312.t1 / gene=Cvel_7312 / organism=Chromera_velia_CCMP2878 / gene_product=mRNA cap guanine-N7 methyltransferase, putative / transcript_product=mRNA cap guanine-N7 methyltransferase, putative / location=Cvel_scaffold379:1763-8360(-) / protein_length=818 / sequence_SO=supercontig / SO=protein_coding / is_pseudo=false